VNANAVFAAVAVGALLLLGWVAWYLIQTLKQIQQTARSVELFLDSTRPRIEEATARLGSVLDRTDRFLGGMEDGQGASGTLGFVGQALSGWMAGTRAVSTITATIAAFTHLWSKWSQSKTPAEPAEG